MYSQFNEDQVLEDIFRANIGTYVDVGCGPAQKHSNTYALYLRGWNGLIIDPQEVFIREYEKIRPNDIPVKVAVSNKKGTTTLYDYSVWATLEKPQKRRFGKIIEEEVKTDTLSNILDDFPAIRDNCQLCNIDVEHHERQVLEGIDFSKFKPEVFLIEAFEYKQWEDILLDNGYTYYKASLPVPVNRFYVRSEK